MAGHRPGVIAQLHLPQYLIGLVERGDDGIQGLVNSLDDRPEVAAVFSRVGPDIQFAGDCRLGQHVDIVNHRLHRVDAHVEIILDLIKIAVIAIGDLGRDVALGYPVNVLRGYVQRPDHRIQRVVKPFDNLTEITAVLGNVGSDIQFAL